MPNCFLGGQALKEELLGQMSERLGPAHYGEERPESQVEKAERVLSDPGPGAADAGGGFA
jgi:hypothetical protein